MRCLLCYNSFIHAFNPNTKEIKSFITYYKTCGITTLKKHVDNDHVTIVKTFNQKVNILVRGPIERQLGEKMNVSSSAISKKIMSK
jgi:hypothetical protein